MLEAGPGLMVQAVGHPTEELGLGGESRRMRASGWKGAWSRSGLGRSPWDCGSGRGRANMVVGKREGPGRGHGGGGSFLSKQEVKASVSAAMGLMVRVASGD